MLIGGALSFIALLALFRALSGDPIIQPSGDIGILVGFALVVLYFVISDTRRRGAR